MNKKHRILIIEDEEILRFTFRTFLSKGGYSVVTAENYDSARVHLTSGPLALIIADILLGDKTGIDILRQVKTLGLNCPVILITGKPSIETAAESVRLGAYDYLTKPVEKHTLLKITRQALQFHSMLEEKKQLALEKEKYRSELDTIFRSVQDGIMTVDKNLTITKVNTSLERICSLPGKDVIGKRLSDVSKQCRQTCGHILETVVRNKKGVRTSRIECSRSDKNRIVVLTASPLRDQKGHFSGAALVVRDLTRQTDLENRSIPRKKFMGIIGQSQKMQAVYTLLEDLNTSDATVLVTGESGTGKELVARALHFGSHRAEKPFVKVNCGALSGNLLESELFGHVKGAFTGAIKNKVGRFEAADTGTILLDEIGDISQEMQIKLLRVIQEKEFDRVGESSPVQVDVRIISSTNKDLKTLVALKKFRSDLYYRLKVIEIKLPPLRERVEDIPLLTEHFITLFNKKLHKSIEGVLDSVNQIFLTYAWPGNIRELEHVLEHAFTVCHSNMITTDHLSAELRQKDTLSSNVHEADSSIAITDILEALEQTDGNKAKAARLLGINRKTIYRKLSQKNASDTSSTQ